MRPAERAIADAASAWHDGRRKQSTVVDPEQRKEIYHKVQEILRQDELKEFAPGHFTACLRDDLTLAPWSDGLS